MEKNKTKILINALIFIMVFLCSCEKKNTENPAVEKSQFKNFSLTQFSEKTHLVLTGEAAELKESDIKVKQPSFKISGKDEVIEIKTGKNGNAEIQINPETKQIQKVIFTGQVHIIQIDKKSNDILMEAECGKLTYSDKEKILIMEDSPIIKREKNTFSGEKIYYYLEKNTLQIKGNVNVKIIPEK